MAATVVWIHAKYYGWRYAAFLSLLLYISMVAAGVTVHILFAALGIVPTERRALGEQVGFAIDYTFWLNLTFLAMGSALAYLHLRGGKETPAPIAKKVA